eukprot:TRINITY_DN12174_c0_g2_i4.p1 TRINITY_DN12174_c0_g2~~TRINITY_DN12174_c0_g2_i4.p1  ORF type:complete len:248 (+),score=32.37 TRINITY_DN12174_c0_g2_i4:208-951(+)
MTLREIYRAITYGVYGNKKVLLFLAFLLLHYIGFTPTIVTQSFRYINKGLKKELISLYLLMCVPFKLIVAIIFPKMLKLGTEVKVMLAALFLLFIPNMGQLWLVNQYEMENIKGSEFGWYIVTILSIHATLDIIFGSSCHVFKVRSADMRATGTFISLVSTCYMAGKGITGSFVLFSISYVEANTICYIFWVFEIIFLLIIAYPMLELNNLPREEFRITEDKPAPTEFAVMEEWAKHDDEDRSRFIS